MNHTHPIRIGMAGAGYSAAVFHAPFYAADPRFTLQRIYARQPEKAATRFPDTDICGTFDALLRDDIDLIVITTPNPTHYKFAETALRAGKHVVVEKPLCATAFQAACLRETAKQHNRLLTVYQNRRWDAPILTAKSILNSGKLGQIVDVEIRFERFADRPNPKQWKETAADGVGLVYDLGVHLLDMAFDVFGLPETLYADIRRQHEWSQTDDYFDIALHYLDGKKIRLLGSRYAREPLPFLTIHGTQGSYVVQHDDNQEKLLASGALPIGEWNTVPNDQWGILHTVSNGRQPYPTLRGNYAAFYDNLYAALRFQAAPTVTLPQVENVLYAIECAYRSAQNGQRLTLTFPHR